MKDWQLDLLKSQEDAEAWRKLNEPDPCEKQMQTASVSLLEATRFLSAAECRLADAMAEVFDTPMEYKIGSYLDALQELWTEVRTLSEKYKRGVRE